MISQNCIDTLKTIALIGFEVKDNERLKACKLLLAINVSRDEVLGVVEQIANQGDTITVRLQAIELLVKLDKHSTDGKDDQLSEDDCERFEQSLKSQYLPQ